MCENLILATHNVTFSNWFSSENYALFLPAVDFSQFMFTSCENDRLGALENLVGAEMGSKIGNWPPNVTGPMQDAQNMEQVLSIL